MVKVTEVKSSHGEGWEAPVRSLSEVMACHPWQVLVVLRDRFIFLTNPHPEDLNDERWAIAVDEDPFVAVTQIWMKKGGQRLPVGKLSEVFDFYLEYLEFHLADGRVMAFFNDVYGQPGCPTSWSVSNTPAPAEISEAVAV